MPPKIEPPAIHIVDDDEAVRHSLAFLFDTAGLPAHTYDSATAFLDVAPGLGAGCVVTDIRMPGLDGLGLQRRLRELGIGLPVIVMTGHGDVPLAVQALKAGAVDFIEKPFDDEALLSIVRAALAQSRAAHAAATAAEAIGQRIARLTPRERQVLDALVAGQPNKTIAYDLGTSPRTIEVHRARVMEKMGARSLAELVRMVLDSAGRSAP